jgi:hypothetical protein
VSSYPNSQEAGKKALIIFAMDGTMQKHGPRMPDFLVIGAMKAGTTSLNAYLSVHPQITIPSIKETHFFNRYWERGVDWYANFFSGVGDVCGESTPDYSKYPEFPGVVERIHSILPEVKLIYLIRNPLQRMISHYQQQIRKGFENLSLDEALRRNNFKNEYVYASLYFFQIQQYFPYFLAKNILVLTSDSLWNRRKQSIKKVYSFLGVDPNFENEIFNQTFHESKEKRNPTKVGKLILNAYEWMAGNLFDHISDHWLFLHKLTKYPIIRWTKEKLTREIIPLELSPNVWNELKNILYSDTIEMENFTGEKTQWFLNS